jgi:hypothetical protein
MTIESVAQSFATYRATVLPKDASTIQVEECRRAFYAGAYFLLMTVAYNIGDEATSEEQGIVELEKLKAECEAFGAAGGLLLPVAVPPMPAEQHYTTPDAAEFRPLLQDLGGQIGSALPEGWGFNLLLFPFGDGGSLFYISSAERQDVIAVMREFIKRNTQ